MKRLPRESDPGLSFITLDVVSLYTVIPKDFGLLAVQYWLNKFRKEIDQRFPITFILDALNIILSNCTFCYNKKHFKQITGTAMGTKVAPCYANLVMGYMEELIKSECCKEFGIETTSGIWMIY